MTEPQPSDLSFGQIDKKDQVEVNLGLAEQAHRVGLQKTISNSALAFAAVLFMAAITFGAVLICLLASGDGERIHWHASILVAAFVVPPTVIVIALLRSAYQQQGREKDRDELPMPLLTVIKEIANAVADIFKSKG